MTVAREIRLFLTGAEFLTRLPAPGLGAAERPPLARAAKYFPLSGLLVGAIAGGVWLLASGFPPAVAAGLALAAGMLATGAIHEDGFADCCDGLGAMAARGVPRERALEIMRDSRTGAYGTIGLVFSIGLRWAALASLGPWEGFAALLIAHAAGRAMMAAALALAGYAREDGAARDAGGVTAGEALVALGLGLAAAGAFGLGAGLAAVAAAAFAAAAMLAALVRRLGGYTGDGLGAIEQVAEIAVMAVLARFWA